MSSHLAPTSLEDVPNPRTDEAPVVPAPVPAVPGAAARSSSDGAPREAEAPEAAAPDELEQRRPPTTRVFGIDIRVGGRSRGGGSEKKPAATDLMIGAEPRVDLLPPEVKARRKTRALQRRLLVGVIVVLVLVVAAGGAAWYSAHQAQQQLAAEQARTGTLIAEQSKYAKVSKLEQQTQLVQTAQHVAGATDVDWQAYLDKIQASLPGGVTISTVKVDSETPLAAYAQSQTPLQGPRVGTITFTAMSKQLPDVPAWLNALSKLPGYADANPDTVNLSAAQYSATITMHVNADVFDNRFAAKGSK